MASQRIVIKSCTGTIEEQTVLCRALNAYGLQSYRARATSEAMVIRCAGKDALVGLMTAMGYTPSKIIQTLQLFSPRHLLLNAICLFISPLWEEIVRSHLEAIMENCADLRFIDFPAGLEIYDSLRGIYYSAESTPDMLVIDAVCEVMQHPHVGAPVAGADYCIVAFIGKMTISPAEFRELSVLGDNLTLLDANDHSLVEPPYVRMVRTDPVVETGTGVALGEQWWQAKTAEPEPESESEKGQNQGASADAGSASSSGCDSLDSFVYV